MKLYIFSLAYDLSLVWPQVFYFLQHQKSKKVINIKLFILGFTLTYWTKIFEIMQCCIFHGYFYRFQTGHIHL